MFELQSGVVVLRRRSPRRAGIVAAFLASLAVAPVAAAELEAADGALGPPFWCLASRLSAQAA